jgi:hypothetical protein
MNIKKCLILLVLNFIINFCSCSYDKIPNTHFLRFKLDGVNQEYYNGTGGLLGTQYMFGWSNDEDRWVIIYFPIKSPAIATYTYGADSIIFNMDCNNKEEDCWSIINNFTITITEWTHINGEPIAERVKGTFSGTVTKGSVNKNITEGTFEAVYYSNLW